MTCFPPSGEVPKAIGACQRSSNNVGYTVVLPPQPSGQLPRWGAKNVLPLNLIELLRRGEIYKRIPSIWKSTND